MARCEECIYHKMCYWIALFNEKTPCEHFIDTANVVPLPCKVGDEVWAIRTFNNGRQVPQKGKVSEIYFIDESMQPCIVVKGITRGRWGEKVFPTFEDADRYLQANKIEDV